MAITNPADVIKHIIHKEVQHDSAGIAVDMASYNELIAANKTVQEIKDFVGADSLGYLSVEGLVESVGGNDNTHCLGCFTGNHPIPVQLSMHKLALEATT